MEKKVERKNKYIIYNEKKEVLVFSSNLLPGNKNIFIPSVTLNGSMEESIEQFNKTIVHSVVNSNDLVLLKTYKKAIELYKRVGFKLKEERFTTITNYYSIFKQFTRKDCASIVDVSGSYHLIPDFLTMEELKEFCFYYNNKGLRVPGDAEENLGNSIHELEKRLKFIKYQSEDEKKC